VTTVCLITTTVCLLTFKCLSDCDVKTSKIAARTTWDLFRRLYKPSCKAGRSAVGVAWTMPLSVTYVCVCVRVCVCVCVCVWVCVCEAECRVSKIYKVWWDACDWNIVFCRLRQWCPIQIFANVTQPRLSSHSRLNAFVIQTKLNYTDLCKRHTACRIQQSLSTVLLWQNSAISVDSIIVTEQKKNFCI